MGPKDISMQDQKQPRQSALSFIDKTFRDVWFYIAAVSLVVNMTYTFRPQLIINPTSPISDSRPLSTLFTITNAGAWTLYNVKIQCDVWDGQNFRGSFSRIPIEDEPGTPIIGSIDVDELVPTITATRDCGLASSYVTLDNIDYKKLRIDINISYYWLWGYRSSSITHHFNTRVTDSKIILVPDVEPSSRGRSKT